jgi:formylglycine-generating enzyme required for sulfatase activity
MKTKLLFLALLLTVNMTFANNLQISGVTVNQATLGTGTVTFNVSWNNSWNVAASPSNWDAVWVFVTWNLCSNGTNVPYTHGTLSPTLANHTIPAGFQAMTSVNGTTQTNSVAEGAVLDYTDGLMLAASAPEMGTMSGTVTLMVTNLPAVGTNVSVSVFGMEMVYVPTGQFQVGDGNGVTSSNYAFNGNGVEYSGPLTITNAFETAPQTFYINMEPLAAQVQQITAVPAAFPKGYYGFYIMKYEISEDQYAQFLNNIGYTSAAAAARYANANYTQQREQLNGGSPPFVSNKPDRAMNWLSWEDNACYLAWACLRPMTELEYEKAARGIAASRLNDFAWGSGSLTPAAASSYTFSAPATENGTETTTAGNCIWGNVNPTFTNGDGGQGPSRCGIFATAASTRVTAGASYWGVMELTGNVREPVVTLAGDVVGNNPTTGAANVFTRTWGNGTLTANGGSDQGVATWPAWNYAAVANISNLTGHKGGAWNNAVAQLYVSERWYIFNAPVTTRQNYNGGRGVR